MESLCWICKLCLLLDQLSGVFQESMNTFCLFCLKWQIFDSLLNVCQSQKAALVTTSVERSEHKTESFTAQASVFLKQPFKIYFKYYKSFVSPVIRQIWFWNVALILSGFMFCISLIIFNSQSCRVHCMPFCSNDRSVIILRQD